MKPYKISDGTVLMLSPKPFAQGGEGDLYEVFFPQQYSQYVAKIYKPDKQTQKRAEKIRYMIANPPVFEAQNGHEAIIWAKKMVFRGNTFVGFLMLRAKGIKLEPLCYLTVPKKYAADWAYFNFDQPRALQFRLKLCLNIAIILHKIHQTGHYALGDLKPENIMVTADGLVSMLDLDSIEIRDGKQILFAAPVATPEYTPSEHQKSSFRADNKTNWDKFSLGVIFYRMLCGLHPFTGACHHPFHKLNTVPELIGAGLFANGQSRKYFARVPPPHGYFNRLDKGLQQLFLNCFDAGHKNPDSRPSAGDWVLQLTRSIQILAFQSEQPIFRLNPVLPQVRQKIMATATASKPKNVVAAAVPKPIKPIALSKIVAVLFLGFVVVLAFLVLLWSTTQNQIALEEEKTLEEQAKNYYREPKPKNIIAVSQSQVIEKKDFSKVPPSQRPLTREQLEIRKANALLEQQNFAPKKKTLSTQQQMDADLAAIKENTILNEKKMELLTQIAEIEANFGTAMEKAIAKEKVRQKAFDQQLNALPPEDAQRVRNNQYIRFAENGLYGFRDFKLNKVVIAAKYRAAGHFKDGLVEVVDEKGNVFTIDKSGFCVKDCPGW
jgi:serine/threonine protein kinase